MFPTFIHSHSSPDDFVPRGAISGGKSNEEFCAIVALHKVAENVIATGNIR